MTVTRTVDRLVVNWALLTTLGTRVVRFKEKSGFNEKWQKYQLNQQEV